MSSPEPLDKPKLHKDAAFVDQQTKRTPAKTTAAPTLGTLPNLSTKAKVLQSKLLATNLSQDISSRYGAAAKEAETARGKLQTSLAQPDYVPKWQKESNSVIEDKKHYFENGRNLKDRVYGANLDPSLLPEQRLEDIKESSKHWDRTTGAALADVTAADKKAYDLRSMKEVMDIDLARKTQLTDPRYVAAAARARVAEQFEEKRLLNSFRKPSNPIMMVSGGRAIYRGGVSEEDQIDMLEEQTFRHLAKRKRLGMPLMEQ